MGCNAQCHPRDERSPDGRVRSAQATAGSADGDGRADPHGNERVSAPLNDERRPRGAAFGSLRL